MAESYENSAKKLERRLRNAKRNITGVSITESEDITPFQLDFLEARLDSAKAYWEEYRDAFLQREELAIDAGKDDFPDDQWTSQYDTLQLELIKAEAKLASLQRAHRSPTNPAPSEPSGWPANATLNLTSSASRPHLPEIPIPSFEGDILKWTSFRDTFLSLIHEDQALSNVQKFHYLQGALKGEAATLIRNFPVDDQSYEQAWTKVKQTYDNPRVLASLLIQRILDCDTSTCKNDLQRYEAFLLNVADSIEAFRALNLERPAEFLLSSLALRALDSNSRRHFELSLGSIAELPTADKVIQFVRQRKMALKMASDLGVKTPSHHRSPNHHSSKRMSAISLHVGDSGKQMASHQSFKKPSSQVKRGTCSNCSGDHPISRCQRFAQLSIPERVDLVKKRNLCLNCLSQGHRVLSCNSRYRCRVCGRRHHSLIHETVAKGDSPKPPAPKEETFTGFGSTPSSSSTVLLGTVQVLIKGPQGDYVPARAVLDSGSQHSFITSALARRIGAFLKSFDGNITSLGESAIPASTLKGLTSCSIYPSSKKKELKVSPVVVDRITSSLPSCELPRSMIQTLMKHQLADPHFGTPTPVDILIGGDLFFHIISGAPYPTDVDDLLFCPTVFGLVVVGALHQTSPTASSLSFFLDSRSSVETQLKAFWELEEPSAVDRRHPDDVHCEEHFLKTHTRTEMGRYVVRLPFKSEFPDVGSNREVAFRRLYALEAKFRKDPPLLDHYRDFMEEYATLGHMNPAANQSPYLIPHHGVWQERPQGRKLRVVFDASCPSSRQSLNDALHSGPKLQEDLCSILIQFRLYKIAICADLVKMYRQVLMHPHDRRYQHIVWRPDFSSALEEMELNTVTYGVKSSAFHAIRVIRQLVTDEGAHFPLAASRIPNQMYVDDIVTGADSTHEASKLIEELGELFSKGGFTLSKWASSLPHLTPSTSGNTPTDSVSLTPPEDDFVKILGLFWNPKADAFSYTTRPPPSKPVTKRAILSSVARIFDPLGLLTPVIFSAKTLLQELWKEQLDWDDLLPDELVSLWNDITSDWSILSTIEIPRYISDLQASLQLVGFCDASSKGYAAALYLRAESPLGQVKVSLIKAKSKVAPLKFHSIARLELCGALLLSSIVKSVTLHTSDTPVCFTDSEVVLSWLRTPTHELQVFEANRVSQILGVVSLDSWCHVPSEDNPADVASRGCTPVKLKSDPLWWSGPSWLKNEVRSWYTPSFNTAVLTAVAPQIRSEPQDDWTSRFSSYTTLVRTAARIVRFIRRARTGSDLPGDGPISAPEFHEAELRCISFVQRTYLPKQLYDNEGSTPKDFAQLQPFLDDRGIIRVGGRLQASSLPTPSKHPILIPYFAHFSRLVIDHIHATNFHAGANLCLAILRTKYWIPRAIKLIRGRILCCVQCRLLKAQPIAPVMAPLPKGRFEDGKAFSQVGVDYAGPFLIKESRRRNAALGKAYLCLFVCFSSKAVHLELVSSLTTQAFIAALDRFIARRGVPHTIWSDNGSNFLGASRFLRTVFKKHREDQDHILQHLCPRGIQWKFIPPRAPHFGGLWEAGVRSVKGLLVGSVGKQPFTFEELSTVLSKIEALLNSRPLCPLNEDVDNLDFLTPAHLTLGAPLASLPASSEPPCSTSPTLTRWQLVQAQIAHVWERWRKEYLHTLQQRSKWTKKTPGLKVGDLVILLERRAAVGQWPVARVVEAFPGRDGITRTVVVRTPAGTLLTRAVTSLASLFPPLSERS